MNTLAQVMDEEVTDDGMEHAPICWTVFTPDGKVGASGECCSCSLPELDMKSFPRGAYVTTVEYSLNNQ